MASVMYFKDDKDNWVMRKWQSQCPHDSYILSEDKCQGVEGHDGLCWSYGSDGSYQWTENSKEVKPFEGKCGSIPPSHESYVNPQDMEDQLYVKFYEELEVSDPEVIARLEKGELEDGESMVGPISFEEQNSLVDSGKIDESFRVEE